MIRCLVLIAVTCSFLALSSSNVCAQPNAITGVAWKGAAGGPITVTGTSSKANGAFVGVKIHKLNPNSLYAGPSNGTVQNSAFSLDVGTTYATGNYAAIVTMNGVNLTQQFNITNIGGVKTITLVGAAGGAGGGGGGGGGQ